MIAVNFSKPALLTHNLVARMLTEIRRYGTFGAFELGFYASRYSRCQTSSALKSITTYPSRLLLRSQATLTSLNLKGVHIHIPTILDLPNL